MFGFANGHAPVLALALAFAWLAGMRVYLAVLGLGLAGALGWIALPAVLHAVASPWVIGAFGALALVECVVDKIPGLDGGWDLLHALVRVPVGALVFAALLAGNHRLQGSALLAGGALALCSHALKTIARRLINRSPEPLSNWSASLAEDLACFLALGLAIAHPWRALGIAAGSSLLVASLAAWRFGDRRSHRPRPRTEAAA
jgi:hypothetical protein